MLDVRFTRSNTFRWAFGVACLFATFVTVLFAFIYFNIDDYLVARSDRVIMAQVGFLSALPLERRISAIEDHLAGDPRNVQFAGLFDANGSRIGGNVGR